MNEQEKIIAQTKKWIGDVVIGCNFCPFAAPVVKKAKVAYRVEQLNDAEGCLVVLGQELTALDENENIETSFLILPNAFTEFEEYLDLVESSEHFLIQHGYEGIYQLASFHPDYCFEGADKNDAANFTNRSPYPMLHLLRESSIDKALENYKDPEQIPERNIHFAREKGLTYMKMLRDACF